MDLSGINKGIQKRIIKSMLIISIFPLVAGLYLTYLDVTKALRNSIGDSFQEEATEVAHKVDLMIKGEVIGVRRIAITPAVKEALKYKGYNKDELNKYIREFKYFDEKEVYSLMVVDSGGRYIAGIHERKVSNYKNEKWFNVAYNNEKGKVYVGDLKLDEETGRYLMNIAAPVIENEKAIGVVVVKYTVDNLLEVINSVRIGKTGHANLVDSTGSIIMCPIYPLRSHHISVELVNIISKYKRFRSIR